MLEKIFKCEMNSCNLPGILRTFISPSDNPTANNSNREARAGMTRAEMGPDPHRAAEGPEGLRWLPSSPLYLQLPELSELEALLSQVNLESGQPGVGAPITIECQGF